MILFHEIKLIQAGLPHDHLMRTGQFSTCKRCRNFIQSRHLARAHSGESGFFEMKLYSVSGNDFFQRIRLFVFPWICSYYVFSYNATGIVTQVG